MLLGTWSQAHAYDPSDYMEIKLKVSSQSRKSEFRVFNIVQLNVYSF